MKPAVASYVWSTSALGVAEMTRDGVIRREGPGLERLAGASLVGRELAAVVSPTQRADLRARIANARNTWSRGTCAFLGAGDADVHDRDVWLMRDESRVIAIVEPPVDTRRWLIERLLELNDDLIGAQHQLVRDRGDLERTRQAAVAATRRLQQLETIVRAGLERPDVDGVLADVLDAVAGACDTECVAVLLADERAQQLVVRASIGLPPELVRDVRVAWGEGIAGQIAATGAPLLIDDLETSPAMCPYLDSGSLAGVPLRRDGRVIGVLQVSDQMPGRLGQDHLRVLEAAAERAALAIGHAQVAQRERQIAETLQRSLMPHQMPQIHGLALHACYLGGTDGVDVGGDWYDVIRSAAGHVLIAVGDVAGKGLHAASVMSDLRSALRAYALESPDPADVLARLDRLTHAAGEMATAQVVAVDLAHGTATVASAGHLPPLVVDGDGFPHFAELAQAPPLGCRGAPCAMPLELRPGARVLLYTDGLVERRGEALDEGLARLRAAAADAPQEPEALCEHVLAAQLDGLRQRRDDIALLALAIVNDKD